MIENASSLHHQIYRLESPRPPMKCRKHNFFTLFTKNIVFFFFQKIYYFHKLIYHYHTLFSYNVIINIFVSIPQFVDMFCQRVESIACALLPYFTCNFSFFCFSWIYPAPYQCWLSPNLTKFMLFRYSLVVII